MRAWWGLSAALEILCLFCLDVLVPVNSMFLVTSYHTIWERVTGERPLHRSLCGFLPVFGPLRKMTILIFCYLCLKQLFFLPRAHWSCFFEADFHLNLQFPLWKHQSVQWHRWEKLYKFIESQNGLGWKGPYRSSSSTPSAMGRDPFPQPRVLRALSNLALNPAREGAATAPLGNLGQGLTTLRVNNFFLISNLNLPSFRIHCKVGFQMCRQSRGQLRCSHCLYAKGTC